MKTKQVLGSFLIAAAHFVIPIRGAEAASPPVTPEAAASAIETLAGQVKTDAGEGQCENARAGIAKIGDLVTKSGVNIKIDGNHTPVEQDIQRNMTSALFANMRCAIGASAGASIIVPK